uniref:Uncharacterized protein n=1 Tax=Arundo donax TaxID=35708 RepID=A0A0A8Z7X5_ARUDO
MQTIVAHCWKYKLNIPSITAYKKTISY